MGNKAAYPTFFDYLRSTPEIDCDLIIGDCDMPATFVWDHEYTTISETAYKAFRPIMDAPYEILKNGNIEIFCDDEKLGEQFCWAAAGYIDEDIYNSYFETKTWHVK